MLCWLDATTRNASEIPQGPIDNTWNGMLWCCWRSWWKCNRIWGVCSSPQLLNYEMQFHELGRIWNLWNVIKLCKNLLVLLYPTYQFFSSGWIQSMLSFLDRCICRICICSYCTLLCNARVNEFWRWCCIPSELPYCILLVIPLWKFEQKKECFNTLCCWWCGRFPFVEKKPLEQSLDTSSKYSKSNP